MTIKQFYITSVFTTSNQIVRSTIFQVKKMSSIISFISILVAATIIAEGKYLLVEIEKSEGKKIATVCFI